MSQSRSGGTDITDYPDAVRRVTDAHVGRSSMTAAEVQRDLEQSGSNRLSPRMAQQIADAIVTEDDVLMSIESSGEIPTDAEISNVSALNDEYQQGDRVEQVTQAVRDRVATIESIEREIRSSEPTTRSEVRDAVREAGEMFGGSEDEVVAEVVTIEDVIEEVDPGRSDSPIFREDVVESAQTMDAESRFEDAARAETIGSEAAREVGAPTRQAFQRAATQTLTQEQVEVTPDTPGYSGSGEVVSVVRDQSGDVAGVLGSQGAAGAVAEQEGAEVLSGGIDSFGLEQGDGSATLTIDGRAISEVC